MVVTGRAHCSILLYVMLQIDTAEHSNGLGRESLKETLTIFVIHRYIYIYIYIHNKNSERLFERFSTQTCKLCSGL